VVLPALPYIKKTGTYMNMERRVQRLQPALPPDTNDCGATELIRNLSDRLGISFQALTPAGIFEEKVQPLSSWSGIRYSRLEQGGLHWPCPGPDHSGTPILFESDLPAGPARFSLE
jgi:predicted molibdopterin-dependent oxidoreductase YjgC